MKKKIAKKRDLTPNLVALSTYVSPRNKTWLKEAAKRNGQKLCHFLDNLISDERKHA